MKRVWQSLAIPGLAIAGFFWAGCASNDAPPPLHSVLKMERVETASASHPGARTNDTISDWETNHPYGGVGAGGGAGVGGAGSGTGSSSGSAAGAAGLGSGTSTSSLGATSGRTAGGTVTNIGGGVVTPLPGSTSPGPTFTNNSTLGAPTTNSFGLPR